MKFEELYCEYFEYLKPTVANTTFYNRFNIAEIHIRPYFKDFEVNEITPLNVKTWQKGMQEKTFLTRKIGGEFRHYSYPVLHDLHYILSQIFKFAIKFHGLEENPADLCGKFKSNGAKRINPDDFFTLEEFKQFISCVDNEFWNLLFTTLYFTGLRIGEFKALQWQNFNNSYLTVTKSYDRTPRIIPDAPRMKEPKTVYSVRQVLLPPQLNQRLIDYHNKVKKLDGYNHEWFIFGNKKVLSTDGMRYQKNKYCSKTGVKIITFQGFRHSHASLLINSDKNVNLLVVAQRMGHKDITRTMRTYSHLFPSQEVELLKTITDSENFVIGNNPSSDINNEIKKQYDVVKTVNKKNKDSQKDEVKKIGFKYFKFGKKHRFVS